MTVNPRPSAKRGSRTHLAVGNRKTGRSLTSFCSVVDKAEKSLNIDDTVGMGPSVSIIPQNTGTVTESSKYLHFVVTEPK